MNKNCIIICNPESGKKNGIYFEHDLRKILNKYHYSLDIKYTKYKGHATSIVENLKDEVDLVIAAGGDGTLNEVVTGNLKRKKKLLIAPFPLGTSNDVGNMYGLTKNYSENLENLLNGSIKNIDICTINKQPFVYVACFGKFVEIAYKTPRKLKEKYGSLGYLIYGLKQLGEKIKPYHVEYTIGNQKKEGNFTFVFVTNSTRVAGVDGIYNDVLLDDNQFEVALCGIKKPKDIITAIYHLTHGDIEKIPEMEYFKTNKLMLKFTDALNHSWCIDGEEYNDSNFEFYFEINKEMSMLVPNTKVRKLFQK